MTNLDNLTIEDERSALLEEAAVWKFLHDLFRVPSKEQWDWLETDVAKGAWQLIACQIGKNLPSELPIPETYEEFEGQYLSTFEVGAPNPPVPLIESHWNRFSPVPKVLHENMLFYKQFGLELQSSANETADNLRHQLEFVHYMSLFEARVIDDEEQREQVAKGRHEYIQRHLDHWLPKCVEKLDDLFPGSWQEAWMILLAECCRQSLNQE